MTKMTEITEYLFNDQRELVMIKSKNFPKTWVFKCDYNPMGISRDMTKNQIINHLGGDILEKNIHFKRSKSGLVF